MEEHTFTYYIRFTVKKYYIAQAKKREILTSANTIQTTRQDTGLIHEVQSAQN